MTKHLRRSDTSGEDGSLLDTEAYVLELVQPLADELAQVKAEMAASKRAWKRIAVLLEELESTSTAFAGSCARIRSEMEETAGDGG